MGRAVILCCMLLAGCAGRGAPVAPAPPGWRAVATADDRARLADWRGALMRGIAQARAAGHAARIDAEGVLLVPDAALDDAALPPGDYRCRVTKLGAARPGMLPLVAYPAFRCTVTPLPGGGLSLAKVTGSQRPVGRLWPGDARHLVFLGTMALGDEAGAQPYGRDAERDMIGRLERIGPTRWRLILPRPRWESIADVLELVPA